MSSKSRTLLLVFALVGLGASTISSYVHYQLLTEALVQQLLRRERRGELHAGLSEPVRQLHGRAGGRRRRHLLRDRGGARWPCPGRARSPCAENAAGYIFVLSTVGLAFALYLAWASYAVLRRFLHPLRDHLRLGHRAVHRVGWSRELPDAQPARTRRARSADAVSSPIGLVALLVILGGGTALIVAFPTEASVATAQADAFANYQPVTPEQRRQIEDWWAVQPTQDLPIPPSPGTKVQIVKFSDYQCPACRTAFEALKPVLAKYEGQGVEFVKRHYPLEPECNPNAATMNHYGSCEAAAAYEMAKGTPGLARLDEWLFDHQQTLTRDVVRTAAAEQAGIEDFDARYEAALEKVKADAALGKQLERQLHADDLHQRPQDPVLSAAFLLRRLHRHGTETNSELRIQN